MAARAVPLPALSPSSGRRLAHVSAPFAAPAGGETRLPSKIAVAPLSQRFFQNCDFTEWQSETQRQTNRKLHQKRQKKFLK
jgi:hypothetical protein